MIEFELNPNKLSKEFSTTDTGQIFSIDANIDNMACIKILFSKNTGKASGYNLNLGNSVVNISKDSKIPNPSIVIISISKEHIHNAIKFTLRRMA